MGQSLWDGKRCLLWFLPGASWAILHNHSRFSLVSVNIVRTDRITNSRIRDIKELNWLSRIALRGLDDTQQFSEHSEFVGPLFTREAESLLFWRLWKRHRNGMKTTEEVNASMGIYLNQKGQWVGYGLKQQATKNSSIECFLCIHWRH